MDKPKETHSMTTETQEITIQTVVEEYLRGDITQEEYGRKVRQVTERQVEALTILKSTEKTQNHLTSHSSQG